MWTGYLASIGEDTLTTRLSYKAWHFDITEESANQLAELVTSGKKHATASCPWAFDFDNEPLPEVGDLSIITNWNGIAQCVIRTEGVVIKPYRDVDQSFAAMEGEGDLSLQYWRMVHETYFKAECKRIGKIFTDTMPVVCETFKVVYQ
jgi:uncharacterized protein YhfF